MTDCFPNIPPLCGNGFSVAALDGLVALAGRPPAPTPRLTGAIDTSPAGDCSGGAFALPANDRAVHA
jgi:hypothetical protein